MLCDNLQSMVSIRYLNDDIKYLRDRRERCTPHAGARSITMATVNNYFPLFVIHIFFRPLSKKPSLDFECTDQSCIMASGWQYNS